VLTLYHLKKENYFTGALFFAIALLIKPQAIMFAPVVGLAYFYALFKKGGFGKAVGGMFGGLAIIAAVIFLGSLPFKGTQSTFWIIGKYAGTVGSYPYATLNAFNLFALSGGNWVRDTETFLLYDYRTWGMIFLVIICVAIVFLQWRSRETRPYFDLSAFLIISLFMLMHMVHERYIVPACVLLVFAYAYSRDTSTLIFAGAYSLAALVNQLVTLYADTTSAPETPLLIFSAINVALYVVYAVVTVRKLSSGKVLIKSPAMLG
jgi:Gpi18-like mannosyltransferase